MILVMPFFLSYLNGASLRNFSLNLCCSTSNAAQPLRRTVTSFACKGATCCFTVIASFFMLFHFSGSSYKQNLKAGRHYFPLNIICIWSLYSYNAGKAQDLLSYPIRIVLSWHKRQTHDLTKTELNYSTLKVKSFPPPFTYIQALFVPKCPV